MKTRWTVLIGMIVTAAASRLIPHPYNFAPITAMALFGGANFSNKRLALLVPLTALFLSDLVLGTYRDLWFVYGSFAMIVGIGYWLRQHRSVKTIAAATLTSSLLFFVVTNFGVWAMQGLYPKTVQGLLACYVAAIPFLQNTLLGDFSYVLVLFGGLAVVESRLPAMRESSSIA